MWNANGQMEVHACHKQGKSHKPHGSGDKVDLFFGKHKNLVLFDKDPVSRVSAIQASSVCLMKIR
jgi:hypothetical protein